ncbi:peptide-methionine (S)-S-oxide reductase [Pedobacter yulinensis]|uniref:Peptide methionine sulfoxide reductase MsrA n=1 Tax=Pedobacter yulinensis TaxID=2126353 RepID=A0A2T3HH60_9SPHI|nr:peptide-methionine (S)-S-oxide reductase MsrA [Pedobacter yulinensis]PST81762.1 peptide-methionine (S)-S-oxide reductase [Pedobacter yulinensis]
MKKSDLYLFACMVACLLFGACQRGQDIPVQDGFAVARNARPGERTAVFAAGCFWATQECMLQLKGVNLVISGYAGGGDKRPDYESITSHRDPHAESVLVYYDPEQLSYHDLARAFFFAHDPTQVDRQGPDVGPNYRSAAFFKTQDEAQLLRALRDSLDLAGVFTGPVATELMPLDRFFPAEAEHQDYYRSHTYEPYIRRVSKPKVEKLRSKFPQLMKP